MYNTLCLREEDSRVREAIQANKTGYQEEVTLLTQGILEIRQQKTDHIRFIH